MRRLAWALVLGFLLSLPALPAGAGVGVWTPVGGMPPLYSHLVADPRDPQTLYALIQVSPGDRANALWKSTDGGETWRSMQKGIGPVDLLAVDPLQPSRLYAWDISDYAQPKLWASADGGDTWTLRYAAVPNSDGPYFWQIVASPVREGVLYGWADSSSVPFGTALYRSADGGATWTLRGSVVMSRVSLEPLLHHPTRNLLEYFDDYGFYTSRDNGLTWTARSTFRGQGFQDVTRSAAAPDRLYALPAQGSTCLLRSDDDGMHWRKTRSSPAFPGGVACSSVSVDPTDPDRIALTAEGQLGRQYVHLLSISRDGGATWSRPRLFPASFVLATGDDSGTLFAMGGSSYPAPGPYRSRDDGLTWTPSWDGITAGDFRAGLVALPAAGPAPVLVATVGGQLLRSEDGGAAWEALAPSGAYQGVVADADGRTLYVLRRDATSVFLLKSADGGLTWVEISRVPYNFGGLRADPFQPGRLFVFNDESSGPERITVWRSTDGGQSWARRSAGLPTACGHIASVDVCPGFYAMASDPRNPDRVVLSSTFVSGFSSANPGIFVSTDGGTHWRLAAQGPPTLSFSLAADPAAPGVFLAGTRDGIYRSVDGGEHWARLKPGLPVVDAPVVQWLRDGRNGVWYAVTAHQGIFRGTDGGTTWTRISDGLADLAWPLAVLDPQTPDRLFAAVRSQGVWTWSKPGS